MYYEDLIIKTPLEAPCFMMQTLCLDAIDVLCLYDRAPTTIPEQEHHPLQHGAWWLCEQRLQTVCCCSAQGNIKATTMTREVSTINNLFLYFNLKLLQKMISSAKRGIPALPLSISNSEVKLLIGIRCTKLTPDLVLSLPHGLFVHRLGFKDI